MARLVQLPKEILFVGVASNNSQASYQFVAYKSFCRNHKLDKTTTNFFF
jgi:hypothetical protein